MPRTAKELSAISVKKLAHSGSNGNEMKPVSGVPGLYLHLTLSGSKSWIARLTIGGRRRELGLGGYPEVSLSQDREVTRELRRKIRDGVAPRFGKGCY